MLNFSIALFAVAAVLGLIVLLALLKKKETPKPVVLAHGAVAAIALVLLIVYGVQHPDHFPKVSIIIFALAAIGGFYLFFNDMKKKPGPVSVAIVHALAAVAGFVVLLLFAFI
jgi:lysozyme family protein